MQKRILCMLLGIFIAADLCAANPAPYPNELTGLKFYERFLAPLRLGQSDTKQVVQVLGSNQGVDLKDWKIGAYYSCTGTSSPALTAPEMIL